LKIIIFNSSEEKGVLLQLFSKYNNTYNNQSTAIILITASAGRPTVSNTITIVTKPAWGIPAAPILAAVAVKLYLEIILRNTQTFK